MREPNFFLVGAAKAGTTALCHYLDQHPQIYMSPIKEPGFLADEMRIANFSDEFRRSGELRKESLRAYLDGPVKEKFSGGPVESWSDYLKLFQRARDEIAIGEASPAYLWSPTAPDNIAACFPDAKILMVLRNPVDRAFSQYLHMLSFAGRPITFRAHMDAALQSTDTRIGELYPFLHFGFYVAQAERYFARFPRERIQIHLYDDYARDPASVLRATFRFLAVDENFTPDLSQRHMEARVPRSYAAQRLKHLVPPMVRRPLKRFFIRPRKSMMPDPADRQRLADLYRDDIRRLSALLQRDTANKHIADTLDSWQR